MNEEDIKSRLTEEEYHVLREGGTEVPYSGKYYAEKARGMYKCKVCGSKLFHSDAKFYSDLPGLQGWPSFDEALPGAVEFRADTSMGMRRTEVVCATCKSHLGHMFDDKEAKTGKHLCINSTCLELEKSNG